MNKELTLAELRVQLACMEAGILWPGTLSHFNNANAIQFWHNTISGQLQRMDPEEAYAVKRRFRKLWRNYARRHGLQNNVKSGNISSATKRAWAVSEAVRLYNLKYSQAVFTI